MQIQLLIEDDGQVAAATEITTAMAIRCGFGERATERLASATAQAATLALRRGYQVELFARPLQEEAVGAAAPQIELLVIERHNAAAPKRNRRDSSPAEAPRDNAARALSRAGCERTLGALASLATSFDRYGLPAHPAVMRMTLSPDDVPGPVELPAVSVGAICVPPRDTDPMSADNRARSWRVNSTQHGSALALSAGALHGEDAEQAAQMARRIGAASAMVGPAQWTGRTLSGPLPATDTAPPAPTATASRTSRDAALLVARLDAREGHLDYAGLGTCAASLLQAQQAGGKDPRKRAARASASPAGPSYRRQPLAMVTGAGKLVASAAETQRRWPAHSLFVMHGDGLASRWRPDGYPCLPGHHPAIVAALLYRDFSRGDGGVTVLVCGRSEEVPVHPAARTSTPRPALQETAQSAAEVQAATAEAAAPARRHAAARKPENRT